MRTITSLTSLMTVGLALALFACGGDDEPPPVVEPLQGDLEVIGTWESQFGGDFVITKTTWDTATVREYSNATNTAYVQNPATDMFNPNKFAKNVWTNTVDGNFYYCTIDFGFETLDAAKASTKVADSTNPGQSGCGGFPWTKLLTPVEVRGTYTSNFGGMETITSTSWSGTEIVKASNANNYVVLYSDAEAPFNPNTFAKVVWTEPVGGSFHYCFVDFGRTTLMAAETTTKTADATNPDVGGCGGFSWTKLTR
jgi:hypothetical protein